MTIRNTNEQYGMPVEFSGATLEAAVADMQATIRECPELAEAVVTEEDYEIVEDETTTYRLTSTCDDAGNLLANGARTISEHATHAEAEAERQDWLRWYADRGVAIGAGCLAIEAD